MKLGFIGCGKMATAMAKGAVGAGLVRPGDIMASGSTEDDSRQRFLGALSSENGAPAWTGDNAEVVAFAETIVLAVKPQQTREALGGLRDIAAGKLFLSIITGITLAKLAELLGPEARLVRAMPNTPMQVQTGASVYAPGPTVSNQELSLARDLLAASGEAWRLDEAHLDAVTALSGSGPAYVYHFIQGMIDGGEALGLDRKLARELAVQTVLGGAKMVERHVELSAHELADQVKSPGGTTVAACEVLEQAEFEAIIVRAMAAAKTRAEELARH
ncbi:MAG: pyrroline-5-carboxylate reductase [Verrucomicrobiota bacterium]